MTTFRDWDNETEKMTIADLDKYGAALETLLEWPFFKKAYDGFGLPVVKTIVRTAGDRKRADAAAAQIFCTFYDCEAHGKPVDGKKGDLCKICGANTATVKDYLSDPV